MKNNRLNVCRLSTMGLLFTLFFYTGCSTPLPPPDWVLAPPADTHMDLWGVGEGYDLDTARKQALRSAASKLRVNISGTTQSQTVVRNNAVDRTAQSQVFESIQETEFSNVSIEKTQKSKDGFYVLIKIDLGAFMKESKTKFDEGLRLIDQRLLGLGKKTPLEQYLSVNAVLPHVEKSLSNGYLLRVIDPSFSENENLLRLEKIRQQLPLLAQNVVFYLEYSAQDEDIARAMTDSLNSYGMRVSIIEKDLILKITSSGQQELLFDNWSYRLSVFMQIKSDRSLNIASKQYQIFGNSLKNFELARQDAVKRLVFQMKKYGVEMGLGLKNL